MIGRADIEGSKSNVAMNAWLPRASYPCGNSSDTSCIKLVKSKGSIGLLSQSVFILKIKIKRAFALLLYARFLSSLSSPWDICVTI
ncbi:hypothetical protein JTE90_012666 [Oedothorax gibbosus]|uniref:Senescence-associated protein n=2 Tax=Oedothorax gibbosus TaxID=931172 RepID=A0AAV6TJ97_9ARAC|nr:hypothetical protein JTE90_003202 [Oedothorax gibbosus]KAG8170849.1 hypothetical protein JTE90_009669 [Oedothorax gibbosus]KAG8171449.1 hypothetical protein JTE90_022080 [Oedothorax gibbosus]KAG8171756.1 hypothetical protein JTE90_012666 [Oedothorax gibbosus]